jgi:N-acyl-D-aspartate/D-glutamate deacylase
MFETVITGGTIVDGTGTKAIHCDVGIKDGKITAMGKLENAETAQKISAKGCVVAPGFIDVHTHSDASIQTDSRSESQIRQGVTTELVGLCGYGLAPCTDQTREALLTAWCSTATEVETFWHSFEEYLSAVEQAHPATNIAALVSHAALRYMVMNNKCAREATEEEIQQMVSLLDKSLEQGGFGLSTGLEYYPGKQAATNELEALCRVVGRHEGMHASHVRNRDKYALLGFAEVLEVARNTGSRLQISHINPKYGRPDSTICNTLAMIEATRREGVYVGMDVMPTNWNYTSGKALLPIWAHDLPHDELMSLLQSPEGRTKLLDNPTPIWQLPVDGKWDLICHFSGTHTMRYAGKAMAEIAEEKGCSGWEALCALLAEEGQDMMSLRLSSNAFFTDDIVEVLQDPFCSVCSDTISGGVDGPFSNMRVAPNTYTWCERYLRHFILEKKVVSLEEGIRRITSLPAEQIGLEKRGRLAPGYCADVVIFSPDKLNDNATMKEPNVYPTGIQTVLVNGVKALHNDERNKNHAGQVLRLS